MHISLLKSANKIGNNDQTTANSIIIIIRKIKIITRKTKKAILFYYYFAEHFACSANSLLQYIIISTVSHDAEGGFKAVLLLSVRVGKCVKTVI